MTYSRRPDPRTASKAATRSQDAGQPSFFARVRSQAAESLVKNSAFLIINLGIMTLSGYGSLMLLTHFFTVDAVGLSAAAVSASTLIISITQSGINYSLPRFLPTTKNRNVLINTLHTGVVIATAIGCAIFLITPFADKMFAIGGFLLFSFIFIASTCLQAGSTVLRLVLVADRQSGKMTRANIVPNIVRLGAPAVFNGLGNFGAFISRVFYNVFSYIIFARILVRGGHRFKPELSRDAIRELGRFSLGMSVATVIGGLPLMMLPIVVLSRLGAAQSAYWSVAITIGTLLNSLPSMVTQALLPEITHRPSQRKQLLIRSTFMVTGLVVPTLVFVYLGSPFIIGAFGGSYSAQILPAVHWLIFAAFITMLNYASGAILFLAKKSTEMAVINVINAIIVLGMADLWATDVKGIAISWFVGDVANTAIFGLFAMLALREVSYRFEDLGGPEPLSAAAPAGLTSMPASTQEAFDLLSGIAEQQRQAGSDRPYLNLTDTRDLYTARAFQEAESEWRRLQTTRWRLNETRPQTYGDAGLNRGSSTQRNYWDNLDEFRDGDSRSDRHWGN